MAESTGGENVGHIYYDVTLETGTMIAGQRKVDAAIKSTTGGLDKLGGKLTQTAQAARIHVDATAAVADAAKKAEAASSNLADATTKVAKAKKSSATATKSSTAAVEDETKSTKSAEAATKSATAAAEVGTKASKSKAAAAKVAAAAADDESKSAKASKEAATDVSAATTAASIAIEKTAASTAAATKETHESAVAVDAASKATQTHTAAVTAAAEATQVEASAAKTSATAAEASTKAGKDSTTATKAKTKADGDAAVASKKVGDEGQKTAESIDKTAMSAKALAAATRNIPAQFTDIVVGLQGGQRPLSVLMQQGGQLKDMFGGIGPAAKALGGYVLGLVSPLTIGAAAVVTFVAGFVKGQDEMSGFNKTLELGGNKAGVTADQLNALALSMDDMSGVTRSKAAEALTIFAAAGTTGEKELTKFTAAAIKLEKAGGPAVEETAKTFQDLQNAPLQASLRLNDSVNFLTESVYRQIRSLEQQGKFVEAAKVAQNAYADAIAVRTPKVMENLGIMERGWRAIVGVVKEAADAILDIGRKDTPQQAMAATQARIAALQTQINSGGFSTTAGGAAVGRGLGQAELAQKQAELEALQEQVRQYGRAQSAAEGAAQADAKRAEKLKALAEFDQSGEKFLTQRAQMEREITQAKSLGVAAGLTDEQIQKRIVDIQRNYSGLSAKADAAKAYYEGLVAENQIALAKINTEEKKALAENQARMTQDWENAGIYQRARVEIVRKYARERAALEEKTTQDVADLNIAITSDEAKKIELTQAEAIRRADASVKNNTATHAEAERAKTLATDIGEKARAALREKVAQTNADNQIQATTDELTKIELIRLEAIRRADAAGKAGTNPDQVAADKRRANIDAQNSVKSQLVSIDPVAQLEKEYQAKLALVQRYQELIGTSEVGGAELVAAKKAEIDRAYQLQKQELLEQGFAAQSAGNKLLMDSLNSMSSTASSAITGLLTGTMSAADAMRSLGSVVLNEAVGALVQIGMQYLKNALIAQTADKAMMTSKAAAATLYTTAITAQVAVASSLAAANAFAATAAIPVVGPELAPAAATAAGAAAAALGAAAVASAPIAGARQYGGPTSAGSLYRVNETGAPEMFTASNGNQYMMPNKSGSVTPADQVGASAPTIIINNNNGSQVSQRYDRRSNTTEITIAAIAEQIATNTGPIWGAMKSATNIRPAGF